jgi:hypothetical protein
MRAFTILLPMLLAVVSLAAAAPSVADPSDVVITLISNLVPNAYDGFDEQDGKTVIVHCQPPGGKGNILNENPCCCGYCRVNRSIFVSFYALILNDRLDVDSTHFKSFSRVFTVDS